MSWLHYLTEANIYLLIFYLCYHLLLAGNTHYTLSRVYLLTSCIISFIIPLTQISALIPNVQEVKTFTQASYILPAANLNIPVQKQGFEFSVENILPYIYIAGALIAAIVFAVRLWRLFKITKAGKACKYGNYQRIDLPDQKTAFSFFNYLYIGTGLKQPGTIIAHELVHIRQKHTLDVLFLEILKIMNWFSPVVYLVQQSLKTLHEYIADEQTAALESDALSYSSFLLNNAYGLAGAPVTHSFFNNNLLKRRIIMLNQKRSGKLARLKYLAAVPLCAGMLCTSTLLFSKNYGVIKLGAQKRSSLASKQVNDAIQADTTFVIKPPAIIKDGNTIQEKGYLINGKTEYFTVTITDRNGNEKTYNSTTITANDRKMLEEKYGFKFSNFHMREYMKKGYSVFHKKPDQQEHLLPPPPPPIESRKKVKRIPPPPPIQKLSDVNNADQDKSLKALYTHLGRTVRYPAVAFESDKQGRVILTFNVEDKKVSNIKIIRGLMPIMDGEVVRAMNDFDKPLNLKNGKYSMPVLFAITNNGNEPDVKKEYPATGYTLTKGETTTILNEVVIMGYKSKS